MSGLVDKEFRRFLRAAETAADWSVEKRKGNNHLGLRAPCGRLVWLPTSSRGGRAVAEKRAELRRLGLDV